MDVLVAIDALDDLLHNAGMPMLSRGVRVDPDEALTLVERLRVGIRDMAGDPSGAQSLGLVDDLERLVRSGRKVPFSPKVRVDRERLYDVLDHLRAVLPAPGTRP